MGRREAGPEEVLGAVLFLLPDKVLILPPWLPRARLLGLPASLWPQMREQDSCRALCSGRRCLTPYGPRVS